MFQLLFCKFVSGEDGRALHLKELKEKKTLETAEILFSRIINEIVPGKHYDVFVKQGLK